MTCIRLSSHSCRHRKWAAGGVYHASYANTTENSASGKEDYGYKQAIGMYSFTWDKRSA